MGLWDLTERGSRDESLRGAVLSTSCITLRVSGAVFSTSCITLRVSSVPSSGPCKSVPTIIPMSAAGLCPNGGQGLRSAEEEGRAQDHHHG
jgi:hypothetical protein